MNRGWVAFEAAAFRFAHRFKSASGRIAQLADVLRSRRAASSGKGDVSVKRSFFPPSFLEAGGNSWTVRLVVTLLRRPCM